MCKPLANAYKFSISLTNRMPVFLFSLFLFLVIILNNLLLSLLLFIIIYYNIFLFPFAIFVLWLKKVINNINFSSKVARIKNKTKHMEKNWVKLVHFFLSSSAPFIANKLHIALSFIQALFQHMQFSFCTFSFMVLSVLSIVKLVFFFFLSFFFFEMWLCVFVFLVLLLFFF